MSKTSSLFSFAGVLPGMPFGIRLDIDGTGKTGSHVAEDGVSRIAYRQQTEPPIQKVLLLALVIFFSWTAGRQRERASYVFSPLARQHHWRGRRAPSLGATS